MQLDRSYIKLLLLLMAPVFALAQEDGKYLYDGNNLYHSGKVPQSSSKYARALELNPNNRKANFNLGNSLYKNALLVKSGALSMPQSATMKPDSLANLIFDQAAQNFAVVANSVSDKDTLHRAWHNIGNCYLQKKEYQQAVDAYKKALKFDPKDEETRYNLAFALKNLPKQKGGGGGGGQNNPQKKEQKQQPQKQESQMNKDQAEQLLKALMDSEKKLQEKKKQKQEDPANNTVDKDW